MDHNYLGSRGLIAAVAVGAGVLMGAAGVFLYEHLFGEKRRLILQQEVTDIGVSLSEIRHELEILRNAQKRLRAPRRSEAVRSTVSNAESYKTDEAVSVIDDEIDDEFFDLSDTEDQIISLAAAKRDLSGPKYDEIDTMLNGSNKDQTKAYGILLDMVEKDEDNPDLLWRLAKACHRMADIMELQGDSEKKRHYLAKGLDYAQKCLEIAPRSSDAHKWYAVCIGARGQFQGTKDKLCDGLEFKKHVEQALEISPNDSTLYHLLGRFKYEVATLSWVERKVAGALYGEVPYATFPEVVDALTKAEELSTEPWKENRLLLAKSYLQLEEYPKALSWLDKADQVDVVSAEDRVADSEIKTLKMQYNHHRGLL